jgi:hypothetical protein
MNVGGTTVQVVSNASKHIFEHLLGLYRAGVGPENIDLAAQVRLASLQQAVSQALAAGVQHRQAMTVGGWELVFAIEKGKHVLIHALPQ